MQSRWQRLTLVRNIPLIHCPDLANPLLCPPVALIGRAHIPAVGLNRVRPTSNAHFRKVADGVLCFGEFCVYKSMIQVDVDVVWCRLSCGYGGH